MRPALKKVLLFKRRAVVAPTPVNTVLPVILGVTEVGETLTWTLGTWDNIPTGYASVLKADGVTISGVGPGDTSYILQAAELGALITVVVTATNAEGSTPATSAAVGPIAAASDAAATTAFLARTSGLNATHTNAYKALINGLVADGVFAKLDALYLFATQDTTTARLNLVQNNFNCTLTNTPTFTADRGYTGGAGGSAPYLDSGFSPITSGGSFARNSACLGIWTITAASDTTGNYSGGLTSGATVDTSVSNNTFGTGIAGTINSPFGTPDTEVAGTKFGCLLVNRSGASAVQLYKNGVSVDTATTSSVDPTGVDTLTFLTRHLGGGNNQPSDEQMGAGFFGGSLNATEQGNLYTRLGAFLMAVGAI
jgi:hypothetical protein